MVVILSFNEEHCSSLLLFVRQAERQAVNTTVQGSAADIVKVAMIRIDEELSTRFLDTQTTHSHQCSSRPVTGMHIKLDHPLPFV